MMRGTPTTILLAGVGGQGVILAGDVLAAAAFVSGLEVKKSEIHGLSRRFGGVSCQVRIGTQSPLCGHGAADVLVALEAREGLRQVPYLHDMGMALLNRLWIGSQADQATVEPRVRWVDGSSRVRELGRPRGLNLYMLGVLAGLLPVSDEAWHEAIGRILPPASLSANLALFAAGRLAGAGLAAARSLVEIAS